MDRDGFVFISYKSEEASAAEAIRTALQRAGFDVWWDKQIQCGQAWNQVLDDAVRRANCVVVLWTPSSAKSPWVSHEASIAVAKNSYAPARIQLCTIPAPYSQLQATDIIGWDGTSDHPGVRNLIERCGTLVPIRRSRVTVVAENLWMRRELILAVAFAIVAIAILTWQTIASRSQLRKLDDLVSQQDKFTKQQARSSTQLESVVRQQTETSVQSDAALRRMTQTLSLQETNQRVASSILKQTERIIEPLRGISLSAEIVIPIEGPDVDRFVQTLDSKITKITPRPGSTAVEQEGVRVRFLKNAAVSADILEGSPYYPKSLDDPMAIALSCRFDVKFAEFYNHDVRSNAFLLVPANRKPGLLTYDMIEHQLIVNCKDSQSDPAQWNNSGDYQSVTDIRRGVVILRPTLLAGTSIDARTNAIIRRAWFRFLGLSTAQSLRYESEHIYRLDTDTDGVGVFGGSFSALFERGHGVLRFVKPHSPPPGVQDSLETIVVTFIKRMSEFGLEAPTFEIPVRISDDQSAFDLHGHEVVLLPDVKAMPVQLLWQMAYILLGSHGDRSAELATYLVGDFMNTPKLSLARTEIDLTGVGSRDNDPDLRLSSSLWELRGAVGRGRVNATIATALRKGQGGVESDDRPEFFAARLKTAASEQVAVPLRRILRRHGLP